MMKRRNKAKAPVVAETLEERVMLSQVGLFDGTLVVEGTNKLDNVVVTQEDGKVNVNLNGDVSVFDSCQVNHLVMNGGNGDDVLENRTVLNAVINGGNGNDIIRSGGGDDVMNGGNGNDVINDFAGDNVLVGGNGNDTLQSVSSGRDLMFGGNGKDSMYAIVGEPNVVFGGNGKDEFIVRDGVETTDARKNERVVAFRPGEDVGTLRDGVLYLGVGVGGNTVVNQVGNQVILVANGEVSTFDANKIDAIAGIGSLGDDVFVNNTDIDSVYYGISGDDILIGGGGDDLLKGGSGDDVLLGRGGDDDLAGDPGRDVIVGGDGKDKLRVDDLDFFFAQDDDLLINQ